MTITRTTTTSTAVSYPELGVTATSTTAEVTISYDVAGIIFNGVRVTATYTVTVGGVALTEPFRLEFAYSGSGNPLDQAETELQSYFDTLDATATESTTTS